MTVAVGESVQCPRDCSVRVGCRRDQVEAASDARRVSMPGGFMVLSHADLVLQRQSGRGECMAWSGIVSAKRGSRRVVRCSTMLC